jgi:ATP-dependent DNA helicase RecG
MEGDKEYLRITVLPHSFPVSYKGQYHYRSGSTKQELKGSALDQFILKKQGRHWDGVPVPKFALEDLDARIIEEFKNTAIKEQRLDESSIDESISVFLQRLREFSIPARMQALLIRYMKLSQEGYSWSSHSFQG